jgi:hypothetical protein
MRSLVAVQMALLKCLHLTVTLHCSHVSHLTPQFCTAHGGGVDEATPRGTGRQMLMALLAGRLITDRVVYCSLLPTHGHASNLEQTALTRDGVVGYREFVGLFFL